MNASNSVAPDSVLDPFFPDPVEPHTFADLLELRPWRVSLAVALPLAVAMAVTLAIAWTIILVIAWGWLDHHISEGRAAAITAQGAAALVAFALLTYVALRRARAQQKKWFTVAFSVISLLAAIVITNYPAFFGLAMKHPDYEVLIWGVYNGVSFVLTVIVTVVWLIVMTVLAYCLAHLLNKVLAHDLLISTARRRALLLIGFAATLVIVVIAGGIALMQLPEYFSVRYFLLLSMADAGVLACLMLVILAGRYGGKRAVQRPQAATADLQLPNMVMDALRVMHLSDLHITKDDHTDRIEGGTSPNAVFRNLIGRHAEQLRAADLILLTGDATDTGRREEWTALDAVVERLRDRLIFVPGNHDLNITSARMLMAEGPDLIPRRLRLLRCMGMLDRIQGERALVLDGGGGWVSLQSYLRPRQQEFARYAARPCKQQITSYVIGNRWHYEDHTPPADRALMDAIDSTWDAIFPMLLHYREWNLLVVLDSNEAAANIIGNAFGSVSPAALARLRRAVLDFADASFLVALHHHVTFPPLALGWRTQAQVRMMVLDNPDDLLAALPQDRAITILHGHLHIGYQRTIDGRVHILSAPSTTVGDEASHAPPGLLEYGLRSEGKSLTPRWMVVHH